MTKSKTQVKGQAPSAGERVPGGALGVGVAASGGGGAAVATPANSGAGNATPTLPRRVPLSILAVAGAAIAAGYGHFLLGMRFGPPLVMVGLGGMTLALCAAALWRVIDPLTRNEVALIPEARAPHRLRELEREKQAVLKAIKEIELDYQMRKISEADYREMAERYRARALRVMGDLAAGDDYRALIERELKDRLAVRAATGNNDAEPQPAVSVTTSAIGEAAAKSTAKLETATATATATPASVGSGGTGACPACATSNDSDARFCKKCGTAISSSVVPG